MLRRISVAAALLVAVTPITAQKSAEPSKPASTFWQFAVSGDSRNCGDVVMPGITADAFKHQPLFYWHLGDFRKIYDFDEDMQHEPQYRGKTIAINDYLNQAWEDFIEHQIGPWGSVPIFLGIGNHETVYPKRREDLIIQFADWLNASAIQAQRLKDNPRDHRVRTYYHWVERGVDFINLDNATYDQFDSDQVKWIEGILQHDAVDSKNKAIVVGMHAALPESISAGHSMNESPQSEPSGRQVYQDLLKLQNEGQKRVYVLASHSHYFMDGIFNTEYWRTHGGILPGWIVGTGGAVRYSLPASAKDALAAETNVYGYLLGTVSPDGAVRFEFHRLSESDIPASVGKEFTAEFVHWCFVENSQARNVGLKSE